MISDGGVDSSRMRDIGSSFSFQTSIAEKNSRSNRRHPVILGMEDLVEDDYMYYTVSGRLAPCLWNNQFCVMISIFCFVSSKH